jgi:hypothetical protein
MKQLIGLNPIAVTIERFLGDCTRFQSGTLRLPHFMVLLDAHNGQSAATGQFTAAFKQHGLRSFPELDDSLEFTFEGTAGHLRQVFGEIKTNAVYTNEFEGVIAIDIAKLVPSVHEEITEDFLKKASDAGKHATWIFYLPVEDSRNRGLLMSKISKTFCGNVEVIETQSLTRQDLAGICNQCLGENGVRVLPQKKALDNIGGIIESEGLKTAREALVLATRLSRLATPGKRGILTLAASKIQSFNRPRELAKEAK